MADDEITPAVEDAPPVTVEAPEQDSPKPVDTVPPEVKAALRKANKEAETLRLQLKQFEDRDKTDAQKLEERASAAERVAAESNMELARMRLAVKYQIAEADLDLVGSGTDEEMESRAKRVAALTVAPVVNPTSRRPVEQLQPGASPADTNLVPDDAYPTDWLTPSQQARLDGGSS